MKIKRKIHNKLFPHRQLRFFQYSTVDECGILECYYHKWFVMLVFIPTMIIGMFTDGLIPTFKCLAELFTDPYSSDGLTREELKKLNHPL